MSRSVLSFAEEAHAVAGASQYSGSCSPHPFEARLGQPFALGLGLFFAITFSSAPEDSSTCTVCPGAESC